MTTNIQLVANIEDTMPVFMLLSIANEKHIFIDNVIDN
jgi:hypothetical protein